MDLSCVLSLSFQEKNLAFIVAVRLLKSNASTQFGHALRSKKADGRGRSERWAEV